MTTAVSNKMDEIRALCRKHHVRRLELFGSAVISEAAEDFDFLVEFLPLQPGEHADAYFGLLEDLEELLDRPVDLVMTGAITNPYFSESISATRTTLYAA